MQAEIIPKVLIKSLKAIPSKKPDNHLKTLKKLSPGAAYLYKAVLLPKMQGKTVNTVNIDMTAFEPRDIETVCEYYKENIAIERKSNKALFVLYEKLSASPPLITQTSFL